MNLFDIVGESYFRIFTSKYQKEFADCLEIIYNSYKSEISYGVERETIIYLLCEYFEGKRENIQFDEEQDVYVDTRSKASGFLRKLISYGWVECDDNNGKLFIIMPAHSVILMRALLNITERKEPEYQGEIIKIYSVLTREELLNERPYTRVIKPVYESTEVLFADLKNLSNNIKNYIEGLARNETPQFFLEHFFEYNQKIASKAYLRMKTNNNISMYRETITDKLKWILKEPQLMDLIVREYQMVEEENDEYEAREIVRDMIRGVISRFTEDYDSIEKDIEDKNNKYLKSVCNKIKYSFLQTNDIEGKLMTLLREVSNVFNDNEDFHEHDELPEEIQKVFSLSTFKYIEEESLYTPPVIQKIDKPVELYIPEPPTEEEIREQQEMAKRKKRKRFNARNVNKYVMGALEGKQQINASDLRLKTKRDLIRILFISLYSENKKTDYKIIPKEDIVSKNGLTFKDFVIERKQKK